jgi:hypothetical protein
MTTRLVACALCIIAASLTACGRDEAPKPLPASKAEEAKPMPPAAPAAAPAEGARK